MPKSLQAFAAENEIRRGPSCALEKSPFRKAIEKGLAEGIPAVTISRWLNKEKGVVITTTIINRHKRGDCRCS